MKHIPTPDGSLTARLAHCAAEVVDCAATAGRKYIAAASHVLPQTKLNGTCG